MTCSGAGMETGFCHGERGVQRLHMYSWAGGRNCLALTVAGQSAAAFDGSRHAELFRQDHQRPPQIRYDDRGSLLRPPRLLPAGSIMQRPNGSTFKPRSNYRPGLTPYAPHLA